MQRITWNQLLTVPEIAGLRDDARSIAANERRPWYPDWLPTSVILADACRAAAWRLKVDPAAVRPVALTGLLDAYHTAKRRLANPPALKPPQRRTWAKIR